MISAVKKNVLKRLEVSMIVLDVNKITKNFGFGKILDEVSFSLNEGERVAIVGNNGCGKSTLLKIIARLEKEDFGTISIKKDAIVEYLEQGDVSDSKEGIVIDILKSAFESLYQMEAKLHDYENQMQTISDEKELNDVIKKYSNLLEQYSLKGGYDIDVQIDTVVNGLKIDRALLDREFKSLSGGERALVNLAKILLSKPELLLLDEPTNHLDISRLEWLESYIDGFRGTIVIVSHDRCFLDKVAKKIIELDGGKIKTYVGNYSAYLKQKEDDETKEFQVYKVQQKKFQEMENAIKRLKEWGKMADNPTFFRRAKAIQSNLDRLKENAIERPKEAKKLPINFVSSGRGSNEVIRVNNFDLSIGQKQLLTNSSCIVSNYSKVAIIGDNGCGKSTFIKTIMQGDNQNIKLGNNLNIGYLAQIIEFENRQQTLLQYFIDETGIPEERSRSILFNFFFFKKDMIKRVGSLSGGEKLRLKLAVLLQKSVNFIVLDEPTNHIDIETREVLEETLKDFKGTLLFVSHDRFFINQIATNILEFYNQKIYSITGNYDDYLKNKEILHAKY